VSLAEALSAVLEDRTKTAEIHTNPRAFFVHVRIPEHVVEQLRDVQKRAVPNESQRVEIDHVTLVSTKKPADDHPPERVHAALEALRDLGSRTEPIDAKVQGYAYFDSASKGGKPATALVALIDAPMLQHLQVDASRALEAAGVEPHDNHGFTAHATLAYLPLHGRAAGELPPISGKFTIDRAHVAARDHHEIPLTGSPAAQKAASLGVAAAQFALDPSALRAEPRLAPGSGAASAADGSGSGATPPQQGSVRADFS